MDLKKKGTLLCSKWAIRWLVMLMFVVSSRCLPLYMYSILDFIFALDFLLFSFFCVMFQSGMLSRAGSY